MRALLGDDVFCRVPAPETAQPRGLEIGQRQIGDVDIEEPRLALTVGLMPGAGLLPQLQHQILGRFGCGLDVLPAFFHLRKGNGGNPEQVPLHGRAHGAGINGVIPHVGAVVDAGNDQIGHLGKQAGEGDVDAVGGRAVNVAKPVGRALHIQRRIQSERVGLGAVVGLGRDHLHVGHAAQGLIKRLNALRLVAVIIAQQNFHEREMVW